MHDDSPTTIARDTYSPALSRHPKKDINALPTELLLIIFKIVYQLHRSPFPDSETPQPGVTGPVVYESQWSTADMLCPALFPFSIASVCRSWQDIMSMVPVFWMRLLILIDSQPTPLSLVKSYLEWSRDLPLNIFVTRRRTDQDLNDPHEKARVDAVLRLLLPHLHRFTGLRINVMRRSSLPSLRRTFRGDALNLQILKLNCEFDDDVDAVWDTDPEWRFSAPILKEITLDGGNFRDMCAGGSRWHGMYQCVLRELTILHYTPTALHKALRLNDIFEYLGSITRPLASLVLKDLTIQLDEHAPIRDDFDVGLDSMTLESLQGNAVHAIVPAGNAYDLTITRCRLESIHLAEDASRLSLRDISAEWNLRDTLVDWEGTDLTVDECAGFDDRFLAAMANGGLHNKEFMCRTLVYLDIFGCNVSPAALKRMVKSRLDASKKEVQWENIVDTDNMAFTTVAPILGIYVYGGGPLLPEDEQWFEDHLWSFFWSRNPSEQTSDKVLDPNTYYHSDDTIIYF